MSQNKSANNTNTVNTTYREPSASNNVSINNDGVEQAVGLNGPNSLGGLSKRLIALDVLRALIEDLSPSPLESFQQNSASDEISLFALHDALNDKNHTCLHSHMQRLAQQDITANLIDGSTQAHAHIITRENITMCGREWATQAFLLIDPSLELSWHCEDGQAIKANTSLVNIKGSARSILTAERTALNFLQMLSGTATTTAVYAKCLAGSPTALLDTRKTIPGFRLAQKYAVRCGGGQNHRMGLHDAFLIKENHIKACGSISNAIKHAKSLQTLKTIEIEVESLDELRQAIAAGADIVMLDNFTTQQIQEAVAINNQQCKLEVSGNITQERLAELAKTRVDFISSGAITKHINAVDLSLLIL